MGYWAWPVPPLPQVTGSQYAGAVTGGKRHQTSERVVCESRPAGGVRLRPEALFGRRAIETSTAPEETPVEQRLAELFDHLGIARAHLAGRAGTDWQGFAARHPERVASVTLLCPAALDQAALQPLASRAPRGTGDQGLVGRRVLGILPDLPRAETAV